MICLFIAVLFLAVAVWKHLTLEAIKADVAKVDAKVAALLVKGFQASKDDVRAATSNLKKWV